jgi:hypothetical protein
MAERPKTPESMSLEDLARAEAAQLAARETARTAYLEGQKRLMVEVPARFLTLARQLKDAVSRFNAAATLPRPVAYAESAAVTTRDPNPERDFTVEVRRDPHRVTLSLRSMNRMMGPPAFLIEGFGIVGVAPTSERFLLRVEGIPRDGAIGWRVSSDHRTVEVAIDQLADRLVGVIATGELERMFLSAPAAPPAAPERPAGGRKK